MSLRSPLGQVRGLGSAKDGTGHWWAQRVTALALVPLTLWFCAAVAGLAGADYTAFRSWVAQPVNAGLLILLVVATFYHMVLGLQVVIEDYIHGEGMKLAALLITKGLAVVLGLAGLLSVLTILFQG